MRNEIDKMILEATKSRNKERTEVFKAIKNEFLKHKTAKNAKPLDDATEITILQKMVKQREDSAAQFEAGGRPELAEKERYEISVLSEFIPKAPTEEEIMAKYDELFANDTPVMGIAIKTLKENLPGADGSLVAKVVKMKLDR